MSICQLCQRKSKRPSPHAHLTREYFEVLISALRHVAWRHGYALATHGSLSYDIDLIACPWRDSAVAPQHLADAIRKAAEAIIGEAFVAEHDKGRLPEKKPCGRLAWSLHLGGGPYIDLSVMPKGAAESGKKRGC
jgi:hypothetical protein